MAGQRISFYCQARPIGSPIDAQMSIYDSKSMREVAFDNDHDGESDAKGGLGFV